MDDEQRQEVTARLLDNLHERLTFLEEGARPKQIEKRLKALESEATRMKTRYSGIDGQLEKLLLRMTSLEQSSAAERSVLDIHEELGGIQRRLDALQAEAARIALGEEAKP